MPYFLLRQAGLTVCSLLIIPALAAAGEGYSYPLFDGRTLGGWTAENGCRASVREGMLLLEAGNGWLRSDHAYTDFKLHVEWRALKKSGYDAGIYLRTLPGGSPFPRRGYKANLLQGREGSIGNLKGATTSGLIKPAGEWNTFDFTVRGETVRLEINGSHAYTAWGLKIPCGHVGIQVEEPKGGRFLLRNIRVTELTHESLFTGEDLTHWEGAGGPAEECWRAEDGVLLGLKKRGPWLRSKRQYGDFNLRLQYRVDPGANSGIYVRVPKNGNHHREDDSLPPAGFEVQILDDESARRRKLKPYQYCGSVYGIAPARKHVGNKPGEWNTLELNCRGRHVAVVHNGVVIVNAAPEKFPALKLRQLEGYFGLQNHGGGVAFRRIRISPAIEAFPPATAGTDSDGAGKGDER